MREQTLRKGGMAVGCPALSVAASLSGGPVCRPYEIREAVGADDPGGPRAAARAAPTEKNGPPL